MLDFKNLNKLQEVQINHILSENKEKDVRLKPINEYLSKRYRTIQIWELNDFQIAKIKRKTGDTKEILYALFMNYEPLNEMAYTFDQALLVCLSRKYEGYNSQFPLYAEKMLNANFSPEEE